MQIIRLDGEAVMAGKTAFRQYLAATVCGPNTDPYDRAYHRHTGLRVVVGAIMACIGQGITDERSILHAVARVSHCRRSTVEAVFDQLCGDTVGLHFWQRRGGRIELLTEANPDRTTLLLAA